MEGAIRMEEILLEVDTEEMYFIADKYMSVMCGYDRENRRSQKSRQTAVKVREKLFDKTKTDFLLLPFDSECVKSDHFMIKDQKIVCGMLENIDLKSVVKGYAFMFHAPMPDLSAYPISEVYFADCWQTCIVDAGRDILRKMLLKKESSKQDKKLYITDTLAPGMSKIPSSAVKKFFEIMSAEKIDLTLLKSGLMSPVKSFVGILLLIDQQAVTDSMNCSECLSNHKNCEYCKNYAQKFIVTV